MIFELKDENKKKVLSFINNNMHELSIKAVIYGYSQGEIFVDSLENPKSGLIKTPECNVLFGDPTIGDFYWEIFEKLDYYEHVTCDNIGWNSVVEEHHHNCAIKQYSRYSYSLKKEDFTDCYKKTDNVEVKVLDIKNIKNLEYDNSDIAKGWDCIKKIETLPGLKLAAIVVVDNEIVSYSAIDCYYNNKIEIGINTKKGFRGKGYGILAANEMIKESFKYGIEEIGWHCVSINKGSRRIAEKLGFSRKCTYNSYTPNPPIENITDLSTSGWIDYAKFYMQAANNDPAQYWMASRCWASAEKYDEVYRCFELLLKNNIKWFLDCLDEDWFLECIKDLEEFEKYKTNHKWNEKLIELSSNVS